MNIEVNMLQQFAVDNAGKVRSIYDVNRGKDCNCHCVECGETLIAKQGEINRWHFAHESGTECEGGAVGALHLAAQQLILEHKYITVPALTFLRNIPVQGLSRKLPITTTVQEAKKLIFEHAEMEYQFGPYRADISGVTDGELFLIEIAVTHFVDFEKKDYVVKQDIPCVEIDLSGMDQDWTWESLKSAIIENSQLATWLHHPALKEAEQEFDEQFSGKEISVASHNEETQKFRINGVPIHITEHQWGIVLWSPYQQDTVDFIRNLARQNGGWFNKRYRNWRFPTTSKEILMHALKTADNNL